jgi:hypothetical protein
MKPRSARGSRPAPTVPTTFSSPSGSAATAPAPRSRKLLKRSYHLLKALGDQALEPAT